MQVDEVFLLCFNCNIHTLFKIDIGQIPTALYIMFEWKDCMHLIDIIHHSVAFSKFYLYDVYVL